MLWDLGFNLISYMLQENAKWWSYVHLNDLKSILKIGTKWTLCKNVRLLIQVNDSKLSTHTAVIWCHFSKLTLSRSSAHNVAILFCSIHVLGIKLMLRASACRQDYKYMMFSVIVLDLEPVFMGEAKLFWSSLVIFHAICSVCCHHVHICHVESFYTNSISK